MKNLKKELLNFNLSVNPVKFRLYGDVYRGYKFEFSSKPLISYLILISLMNHSILRSFNKKYFPHYYEIPK